MGTDFDNERALAEVFKGTGLGDDAERMLKLAEARRRLDGVVCPFCGVGITFSMRAVRDRDYTMLCCEYPLNREDRRLVNRMLARRERKERRHAKA